MTATASSCAILCAMRMAKRMCATRSRRVAWISCVWSRRQRAMRRAIRCRDWSSSRGSHPDMALLDPIETNDALLPDVFRRWFASRGWTPRAHQLELLAKAEQGRSVLLIAPTGGGKTLAGFLPTLVELSRHLSPLAGRGRPSEARSGEGALKLQQSGEAPSSGSALHASPPSPRKRGEGRGGLHTL